MPQFAVTHAGYLVTRFAKLVQSPKISPVVNGDVEDEEEENIQVPAGTDSLKRGKKAKILAEPWSGRNTLALADDVH